MCTISYTITFSLIHFFLFHQDIAVKPGRITSFITNELNLIPAFNSNYGPFSVHIFTHGIKSHITLEIFRPFYNLNIYTDISIF